MTPKGTGFASRGHRESLLGSNGLGRTETTFTSRTAGRSISMHDKIFRNSDDAAKFRAERSRVGPLICATLLMFCWLTSSGAQQSPPPAPSDAVTRGQQPSSVQVTRPEQKKTAHDLSDVFKAGNAKP